MEHILLIVQFIYSYKIRVNTLIWKSASISLRSCKLHVDQFVTAECSDKELALHKVAFRKF